MPTTITIRIRRNSADAIARAAKRQKCTQKLVICQALVAAGIKLAPDDLADKTPRRPPLA
jgi:hypothetical protein